MRQRAYAGITQEFFGVGAVVVKAKDAVAYAAEGLQIGFAGTNHNIDSPWSAPYQLVDLQASRGALKLRIAITGRLS